MSDHGENDSPQYVIVESDLYAAERDAQAFQSASVLGPEYPAGWLDKLAQTVNGLKEFPGPLSHARDEDASTVYHCEVRRLLYHGPNPRRSKHPVRVLFTLIPPVADDPEGETVISLLRLLGGGQSVLAPDAADPTSPNIN